MCMCMQMIMAQQLRQQKPAAPRMLGGRAAQPPPRLALPWAAARPGWRALRLAAGYEQRPLSQEERGRRSGCAAIPNQARSTGSWQLHQPCMWEASRNRSGTYAPTCMQAACMACNELDTAVTIVV